MDRWTTLTSSCFDISLPSLLPWASVFTQTGEPSSTRVSPPMSSSLPSAGLTPSNGAPMERAAPEGRSFADQIAVGLLLQVAVARGQVAGPVRTRRALARRGVRVERSGGVADPHWVAVARLGTAAGEGRVAVHGVGRLHGAGRRVAEVADPDRVAVARLRTTREGRVALHGVGRLHGAGRRAEVADPDRLAVAGLRSGRRDREVAVDCVRRLH